MELKLTFLVRLKLCWEILTVKSGHGHSATEKNLSTFQKGYDVGLYDRALEQAETVCSGAGKRHPYARYKGYKGEKLRKNASVDEHAAWLEGDRARQAKRT